MLSYLLALIVGLGSFSLYMAAFFFPEVHRRYDLIWSGVGLFYALVLWVCAGRITGGLLLGQIASVAILIWLGWQMLSLRRIQTLIDQQTQLPESANSTAEVAQLTLQQLKSSFHKSATRSPLAARMEQVLDGIEEAWIQIGHWINTSVSTPAPVIQSRPNPETQPARTESAAGDDGLAEWSDLEIESYPEMETIDGAGFTPKSED